MPKNTKRQIRCSGETVAKEKSKLLGSKPTTADIQRFQDKPADKLYSKIAEIKKDEYAEKLRKYRRRQLDNLQSTLKKDSSWRMRFAIYKPMSNPLDN
jgi:hypothetical protein